VATSFSTFCCSTTSFDADGRLDEKALHAHYARVAAAGPGIYAGGSSPGEGYSFRPGEAERVLRIAVEAAGGKVPVRAMGVEPRHADEMVAFLKMACKTGVNAVQIYSLDVGHGWKPRAMELEAYFRAALDVCTVPAIISSHAFMGYNVPIDMLERLAKDYDNLVGVNLTTPDITHLTESAERLRPRLEIHVGGPMHALTAMALGCNGYLSSEASMTPQLCQSVISHFAAGRYEESFKAYSAVMSTMTGLAALPGASTRRVKGVLRLLGHGGAYLRGPYDPLKDDELKILAKTVAAFAKRHNIAELASIKG
jgi:4-hydroxy-tetrahydrodipicolinate synthase